MTARLIPATFVAGAAALLLLAACGSGGGTATGSTAAAPPATGPGSAPQSAAPNPFGTNPPTYTVTIHLTGAFTQDSQVTRIARYGEGSCADRAAHGQNPGAPPNQQAFSVPAPSQGSTTIVVTIAPYAGPGTYDQDRMRGSIATVGTTADALGTQFSMSDPPATSMSATINADGSGKVTFAGAQQIDPSKPPLSGSVSWTCMDAK